MRISRANWISWVEEKATQNPLLLGVVITAGYLLLRCVFDGLYLVTVGFPDGFYPFWRSENWPELVNATLIGYVPAALVIARRGINQDLSQLKQWVVKDSVEYMRRPTAGLALYVSRAIKIGVIVLLVMYVFYDPSMSGGADPSLTHPYFAWALIRTTIFSLLVLTLIDSDIKVTHRYFHLGRSMINVDLLDVQSLSAFTRRGLRSALTWVIFSIIFSLFWLGEGIASQINSSVVIMLLILAASFFVAPLIGVHQNIVLVKQKELIRLSNEIRIEREVAIGEHSSQEPHSPRLANLVSYYQLISKTREWPVDAANLFRFIVYILIGLGSWLGAAIVERLLNITLSN